MTKVCDRQGSNWSGHPHTCMEFKFSDNEAITHLNDLATIWSLILCQVHTKEGVEVICVYMLYS